MTWDLVGQLVVLWIVFILGLCVLRGAWSEKEESSVLYTTEPRSGTLEEFLFENSERDGYRES